LRCRPTSSQLTQNASAHIRPAIGLTSTNAPLSHKSLRWNWKNRKTEIDAQRFRRRANLIAKLKRAEVVVPNVADA
jgi:hypothetical protein